MRLKFAGGELPLKNGVTTLGRTSDNDVSFPSDSNVSRYHAEIEQRGSEFCLIDLNSSNGTQINDLKVDRETYLSPGDRILLGGSSEIVFETAEAEPEKAEEPAEPPAAPTGGPSIDLPVQPLAGSLESPAAGSRTMLMIAGGAVLIAVIVVGVAGAIYYKSTTSACDATARIISPEPGETLFEPTDVEITLENADCVATAVFTLNGEEFASSSEPPFTITLDPKEHPELADGFDHSLGVILIDQNGRRAPQAGPVMLAMETRKVGKPEEKPIGPETGPQPAPPLSSGKDVSLIEIQAMANNLVKQFSGGHRYNVSDKQFLQEVHKRTADYAKEGFFDRASRYRDAVNVAFIREQNLDAPLGYMLAMSRSNFEPKRQGANDGLWQMDPEFVKANAYDGTCGGLAISEPTQYCAARAAAMYMKAIVFGVFDGDAIYSAAVFGKSPSDASAWKTSLPANRVDVWNTIKTAPEREQLVRFFAAGIVAENPQKFGLKRDKPISSLYP
jgi:hypothetical protein